MRIFYHQRLRTQDIPEEELSLPSLKEDIEKTRQALDIAYAGFDNAVDTDMIDCYIYEINALLKRYKHLSELAAAESAAPIPLYEKPTIRTLVSHVLG